jgi:pyruvate dehydrogenase (NADP+)
MQGAIASQGIYDAAPGIIEEVMKDFGDVTGRYHRLFHYYGSQTAENIIISMGANSKTIEETVKYLNEHGANLGCLSVRFFRPWSMEHFMKELPPSVKRIAVMEKIRNDGVAGFPLYQDVLSTIAERSEKQLKITSGHYGLAGKEFTPAMVKGIFDNLSSSSPRNKFIIGVNDDVTHTSLPYGSEFNTSPSGTKQCIFWGLGSDGTVGGNKAAIATIANNTKWKVQGYFAFDSYKTDGTTTSYLRFGPEEIKSEYQINSNADYVACHKDVFVKNYDMADPLNQGGYFVLNSRWDSVERLEKEFPARLKKKLAEKDAKLFNINATAIAQKVGLGKRINMVMTAAFYKLSGVLPIDDALKLLKDDIVDMFGWKKGRDVVEKNWAAVDLTFQSLQEIKYPKEKWLTAEDPPEDLSKLPEFVREMCLPALKWKGDDIPVSKFLPGGYMLDSGLTNFEKRGIALTVPVWNAEKCTQCNYCSLVCPHAAIRPFLLTQEEAKKAPEGFKTAKAKGGGEMAPYNYSIQVSPLDCTGCNLCFEACKDDALKMTAIDEVTPTGIPHWDYAYDLPLKPNPIDKYSVKGSQFEQPLLEFSGACAGCGETAYVKILTQMCGHRMVTSSASGCAVVWGGYFPHFPYTKRKSDGKGVCYGHSLFEDNAEYGYGMSRAITARRGVLATDVSELIPQIPHLPQLQKSLERWLPNMQEAEICDELHVDLKLQLQALEEAEFKKVPLLNNLRTNIDCITKRSYWMIGGDGWAYDIGYGGVDQVISTDEDTNILVTDNEIYANTGGQASKGTQLGASVKFKLGGKTDFKKELGLQAMSYGKVYVCSISLGANYAHAVQCLKEAESYNGPSLVLALAPCIGWGMDDMKMSLQMQKEAVDCGYWPLYKYDPRKKDQPFKLESKKLKGDLSAFLDKQLRYRRIKTEDPEKSKEFHDKLKTHLEKSHESYKRLAMDDLETLHYLKKKYGEQITADSSIILYGSETGNTQALAETLAAELSRRGVRVTPLAMDDYDFQNLPQEASVYCLISTVGQGEFPDNSKEFMKSLLSKDLPKDYLKDTKFSVFGLGDSSYVYFNKASQILDQRLGELGGKRVLERGLGDDQAPDRYETAWEEWAPTLFTEEKLPQPPEELMPPNYGVTVSESKGNEKEYVPKDTQKVPLLTNKLLTPEGYDRDIRHYEFDISKTGWDYSVGDVMAIYPKNDIQKVHELLDKIEINPHGSIEMEALGNRKLNTPSPMTAESLFTTVLDIFGKPSRRFYDFLKLSASNPSEKKELEHLLSKDGKSALSSLKADTITYSELLTKFPSTTRSLPYLLDQIPTIKPRLYSIASAQSHSKNLELCIILDDWTTSEGLYKSGLTTTYLKNLQAQSSSVYAKIQKGACALPSDSKTPLVMAGLGTGIAPLRAMCQDRYAAKLKGESIGNMSMYFGMRYRKEEFLYEDEFKMYEKEGVVSRLNPAFSRDQKHKIYIQDRIKEDGEIVYNDLVKGNGCFYLCGSAKAQDVQKAIAQSFVQYGGMGQKEADDYITQMRLHGRYNLDVW